MTSISFLPQSTAQLRAGTAKGELSCAEDTEDPRDVKIADARPPSKRAERTDLLARGKIPACSRARNRGATGRAGMASMARIRATLAVRTVFIDSGTCTWILEHFPYYCEPGNVCECRFSGGKTAWNAEVCGTPIGKMLQRLDALGKRKVFLNCVLTEGHKLFPGFASRRGAGIVRASASISLLRRPLLNQGRMKSR